MKDTVTVLKLVIDFLDRLNENELYDIINHKAKLKLEYEKTKVSVDYDTERVSEICKKLETITIREEATEYLKSLNINKNTLKEIVRQYNIPCTSKDTNTELIVKIVESVVGAKLRFDALLNTNLE